MSGVSAGYDGPSEAELDFRKIAEGGSNFIARMEALSNLKRDQERAYAKLKIGDDAGKALDDAQRKQAEATDALAEAKNSLSDAKQTAKDLIRKATEQGAGIIKNAQDGAATITNDANNTKFQADEYAKKVRGEADAALVRGKEADAVAARTQQEALAALKDQQDAKATYLQAKTDSEAEKARYVNLRETMAEFVKGLPL